MKILNKILLTTMLFAFAGGNAFCMEALSSITTRLNNSMQEAKDDDAKVKVLKSKDFADFSKRINDISAADKNLNPILNELKTYADAATRLSEKTALKNLENFWTIFKDEKWGKLKLPADLKPAEMKKVVATAQSNLKEVENFIKQLNPIDINKTLSDTEKSNIQNILDKVKKEYLKTNENFKKTLSNFLKKVDNIQINAWTKKELETFNNTVLNSLKVDPYKADAEYAKVQQFIKDKDAALTTWKTNIPKAATVKNIIDINSNALKTLHVNDIENWIPFWARAAELISATDPKQTAGWDDNINTIILSNYLYGGIDFSIQKAYLAFLNKVINLPADESEKIKDKLTRFEELLNQFKNQNVYNANKTPADELSNLISPKFMVVTKDFRESLVSRIIDERLTATINNINIATTKEQVETSLTKINANSFPPKDTFDQVKTSNKVKASLMVLLHGIAQLKDPNNFLTKDQLNNIKTNILDKIDIKDKYVDKTNAEANINQLIMGKK